MSFLDSSAIEYIRIRFIDKVWPLLSKIISLTIIGTAIWLTLYALLGESVGLSSNFFQLIILFIAAKCIGAVIGATLKIPPIIGQIFVGVLFRNIGWILLSDDYIFVASVLRKIALINILLPAGLGLDCHVIAKEFSLIHHLATIPAAGEVLTMAGLSMWVLDIPILWSLLIGLMLAAVSPSVVIPCLFELQAKGFGLSNGVNTYIIAASTLNDIISIVLFSILTGMMFTNATLSDLLSQAALGTLAGILFGILWGIALIYIPSKSDNYKVALRTILIGVGSLLVNFGSDAIGYGNAGILGCILSALVASQGWSRRDKWKPRQSPVKLNFDLLWKFVEPVSFSLIGIEIDLGALQNMSVLLYSSLILVALAIRLILTFIVTLKSTMNLKEKLFVVVSSIPKATVQAAIGPVAFDYVRASTNQDAINYAHSALVVALLSIILTAPIGTYLIMKLGPKFLRNDNIETSSPYGVGNLKDDYMDDDEDADENRPLVSGSANGYYVF